MSAIPHTEAIEIACAGDESYLPHSATMLASLFVHEPGPVRVRFFCDEAMPASGLERLSALAEDFGNELIAYRIEAGRLRGVDRFSPGPSWYRLFPPELCADLERVIYLDSDIVVTDGLRPLWEIDLADHPIAAVRTVFPFREWGVRHCAALGLADPAMYFCAGVMVMNLSSLRSRGFPGTALDHALAHGDREWFQSFDENKDESLAYVAAHPERAVFGDQDTLNALLGESWLPLHPRWNCMNSVVESTLSGDVFGEREREEAISRPAIRHFEGGSLPRPWEPDADPVARDLYWAYRRRTPWADSP